jgi:septal ring factor EnvC (AmiA/AmiB activator)
LSADTPKELGETWFGSGLRAHLGIRPGDEPAPAEPELATEPEPPAPPKITVPEPPSFDEAAAERTRKLREAELELAERERRLNEEAERIERARTGLERRAAEISRAEAQLPVRDILRERAEREIDRLWRTIDDALEATFDDGKPDFHARLAAIKLLLGEAYDDKPAAEALPPRDQQPEDELAARRAERFQL